MNVTLWAALSLLTSVAVFSFPAGAQTDDQPFGEYRAGRNFVSLVGGVEQVDLSSQATATEPFVRLFMQTLPTAKSSEHRQVLAWASIRLLGAPNPNDTNGIFSVFTDPTGQIVSSKLSSVGAALDFTVGLAYHLHAFTKYSDNFSNLLDLIVGFGATTPLQGIRSPLLSRHQLSEPRSARPYITKS